MMKHCLPNKHVLPLQDKSSRLSLQQISQGTPCTDKANINPHVYHRCWRLTSPPAWPNRASGGAAPCAAPCAGWGAPAHRVGGAGCHAGITNPLIGTYQPLDKHIHDLSVEGENNKPFCLCCRSSSPHNA